MSLKAEGGYRWMVVGKKSPRPIEATQLCILLMLSLLAPLLLSPLPLLLLLLILLLLLLLPQGKMDFSGASGPNFYLIKIED